MDKINLNYLFNLLTKIDIWITRCLYITEVQFIQLQKITCHVVVLVSRWAHWGWEEWAASRRSLVVRSQGMLQGKLGWDTGNGRSPDM